MDKENLMEQWMREEEIAHIVGWDFSHIEGRYHEEDDIPWDYKAEILSRLKPDMRLLDIDTGGAEFLLSLGHPYKNLAATENFPPNIRLLKEKLLPLGVDFKEADGNGILPFADESFDMVINRHGDLHAAEIYRILKPNGIFITQQVGAENDRELVQLLLGDLPLPFPLQYAQTQRRLFAEAGFTIEKCEEHFGSIRFFDTAALVWFARIIEWEFAGFSVKSCLPKLFEAQKLLKEKGEISGRTHRFLLIARK